MGELITRFKFGGRSSQLPPAEPSEYGERRARLDAQYMQTFEKEFHNGLWFVQEARERLDVLVRSVRAQPPRERRRSPMETDLHDLFAELCTAMGTLQSNATYYSKLVVEIEERVFNARRFIAENRRAEAGAAFMLPPQFRT